MIIDWINIIIMSLRREDGVNHITFHRFDDSVEFDVNGFSLSKHVPLCLQGRRQKYF